MVIRTKIVCTMGPAVASSEKIEALIEAGMNVARLNFSHGTYEEHAKMIALLKQARAKKGVPLAIMLDTKGPEIRLGKLKNDAIAVKEGHQILFVKEEVLGDEERITLKPSLVFDVLKKDMHVLLDNGYILTHVIEISEKGVKVRVDHGGILRSTKGVNIPEAELELPALTQKDMDDIHFGCNQDIDLIAASFVRSASHVVEIKKQLEKEGKPDIWVIAKIENREGVQNFESIVDVADGIMIARGDLGVEMPLTQVPRLQKMMIKKCCEAATLSVTATQMLESMIQSPRPTRAEASDVANAIYDSTSAVMLSAETAVGQYPIETVKVMRGIIAETESDFDYQEFLQRAAKKINLDVPSSISHATIWTAYTSNARAIFVFTTSGATARLLSRFRPQMPILAMTFNPKVYNQLALCWGVIPLLSQEAQTMEEAYKQISAFALSQGFVTNGDLVVVIAGTPFGRKGTTNMMMIDHVGDALVKGVEGFGARVQATVALLETPDSLRDYEIRGKIIVIKNCNIHYLSHLSSAAGIILENAHDDVDSESFLRRIAWGRNLPCLLRADGAFAILRQGQLITLDPEQKIVFKSAI